jgi:hypothetical protein
MFFSIAFPAERALNGNAVKVTQMKWRFSQGLLSVEIDRSGAGPVGV